ncbi:hypothetical protein FRC17_009190 [Serendipita sp. 399]|nr:hypothetical protein FRC17_009190 [Serendipita sp. 399]
MSSSAAAPSTTMWRADDDGDEPTSKTASAAGTTTMERMDVDTATAHVHESIRSLLADEVPDLATTKGHSVFNDPYLHLSYNSFKSYVRFVLMTWSGVAVSIYHFIGGHIHFVDLFALMLFSALVCSVLTVGVFSCLICKFPLVQRFFDVYAYFHGGFSFVNSFNTKMFTSLTKREVRLSKGALGDTSQHHHPPPPPPSSSVGGSPPPVVKHFNLEVAKLLLLLSSVIYERTSEATRASLQHARSVPKVPRRKSGSGSGSHHGRSTSFGSSSAAGETPPLSPFSPMSFSMAQAQSLHHRATASAAASLSQIKPRVQQAAQSFVQRPSHLFRTFHAQHAAKIRSLLRASPGDDLIATLASSLGLEYEPVSELNSASSAYAAIFWDKTSNWVVLAFKGTSPFEFDEWLTDFDITRVHAGHRLPGYEMVHRGFKNRLFPENHDNLGGSGAGAGGGDERFGKKGMAAYRTPYETIMAALKVVTNDLMSRTDKDINVWFTGHSLGCAIATLTYTRALLNLDGLHPRVQLCDAYLYGAPVVCDMASARIFNDYMERRRQEGKTGRIRSIWRVCNNSDAVTTLLPMLGDDPLYPHTTSLFAYAHLGSEVRMRPGNGKSIIIDNYCYDGRGGTTKDVLARVVSLKDGSHRTPGVEDDSDMDGLFDSGDETEVEVQGGGPVGRADELVGFGMSDEQRRRFGVGTGGGGGGIPSPSVRVVGGSRGASGGGGGFWQTVMSRKGRAAQSLPGGVPWWIAAMEYIPLMGRMVSHFPGLYFHSLQQMGPGDFIWRRR